jgi:hypothetical protein
MRHLVIMSAVALAAGTASAALVEVESNNTLATANVVPGAVFAVSGGFAFDGSIVPDDVDYITLGTTLNAGDFLVASVFENFVTIPTADSMLALFNSAGTEIEFDDDDGPAALSSFGVIIPATGVYTLAITGYNDRNFDGLTHPEDFDYKLIVGVNRIPEPATLGLLAGAAVLGLRRRA